MRNCSVVAITLALLLGLISTHPLQDLSPGLKTVQPRNLVARVVGGVEAEIPDIPEIVSVKSDGVKTSICGGTLLSKNTVLTAAHCCLPQKLLNNSKYNYLNSGRWQKTLQPVTVTAGTTDLNNGGVSVGVIRMKIAPNYDTTTLDNDICVLRLDKNILERQGIKYGNISNSEAGTGSRIIAGWGLKANPINKENPEKDKFPHTLLKANVTLISHDECVKAYANENVTITTNMICASTNGKDACYGDSGGPFKNNATGEVEGVISSGLDCGTKPGIYAEVKSHYNFITTAITDESFLKDIDAESKQLTGDEADQNGINNEEISDNRIDFNEVKNDRTTQDEPKPNFIKSKVEKIRPPLPQDSPSFQRPPAVLIPSSTPSDLERPSTNLLDSDQQTDSASDVYTEPLLEKDPNRSIRQDSPNNWDSSSKSFRDEGTNMLNDDSDGSSFRGSSRNIDRPSISSSESFRDESNDMLNDGSAGSSFQNSLENIDRSSRSSSNPKKEEQIYSESAELSQDSSELSDRISDLSPKDKYSKPQIYKDWRKNSPKSP